MDVTMRARLENLIPALAVGLTSVPWLRAGERTPVIVGGVAIVIAITIVTAPRVGCPFLFGLAFVLTALCGLAALNQSPLWRPVQIDGVPFVGRLYYLPVTALLFSGVVVWQGIIRRRHELRWLHVMVVAALLIVGFVVWKVAMGRAAVSWLDIVLLALLLFVPVAIIRPDKARTRKLGACDDD